MKVFSVLAGVLGAATIVALVGYFGVGAVTQALLAVGIAGFLAICAMQLVLTGVLGLAWGALLPGVSVCRPIWGRLVRDSAAEALPLWQVGGYVLGARALALTGVSWTRAASSTIADVTLEFLAQIPFTALGLGLLVWLRPDTRIAVPVLLGLVIAAAAGAAFVLVQRRGFSFFDRIARHIGGDWAERGAAGAAALHAAMAEIYSRRRGLWIGFALHFACWAASAAQLWLLLWLAGSPLSFAAVLAIESLLYAIRTAAFIVPQAAGVQEGAYILLGAGFGLPPDTALAMSLLKRGRDLAIGLPAIAIWQAIESRRWWRRGRGTQTAPVADRPPPRRD
jgi:putative membrane protein